MTPAQHFAINLGASGDMKDNNGSVWFAYPNPKTESLSNHFTNYGVKFDKQKAIRMLTYALTITDVDMRKQVVSSLSQYE